SVWEFPLIGDIKYYADRPFFHSFVGQTCMVGFSFADEAEASQFLERVHNKERYVPKPAPAPASRLSVAAPAPRLSAAAPAPSPSPAALGVPAEKGLERKESKKDSGGFFGFGRKDTAKKSKLDKSMISAPSDFQHVSHVGYSAQSGFSVQNIPMEWKIIFQKAGITDEQLQDKRQKKVVKQFMKDNAHLVGGMGSNFSLTSAPTAAPNTASEPAVKRAPPPPPPSRSVMPPPNPPRAPAAPAGPVASAAPKSGAPVDLLAAIRTGTTLKSVASDAVSPKAADAGTGDDLADALRNALQNRVKAVAGSDSDDDDDDDEW
ncbi:hypothetical protein HDU91_000781, partial [Kappamyces sp. JEL0680]